MFLANLQKILHKLSYFLEKYLSLCEFSSNAFGEPYISFVLLYSCSMWFNVIQQHYRYKVFLQKGHQKFTYEQTKRSYNIVTPWFSVVDQPELIHGISLSLLAKYLPFCIDSLCSRNVAANWLVYDRYSDYLLKAHSLSSSEYKVRTFCLYLQIFVI